MRYLTILLGFFFFTQLNLNKGFGVSRTDNQDFVPFIINNFEVHNQSWSVSQNPVNHLIYLANSEGLVEFNGIKWEKYSIKDRMPCRSVLVDSSGVIYTGSFEDFGYWQCNTTSSKLQYHSLSALTDIEKNDEIWKIYLHQGRVYFQSFTSIYEYDGETINKIVSSSPMLFMHHVEERFVTQILEKGLFWLNDNSFEYIEQSDFFANKKVHAIIPYGDGKWLVCTDNLGIYIFDGFNFNYFDSEASLFLKTNVCNSAKRLNDSTYAFGSILNGLIITNSNGEILRGFNTHNGLNNNTILSLFVDFDGGLWIGLDEGVSYINLSSAYTHYKTSDGSIGTIYALLKKGNSLYIGTNHGLFVTNVERKGWFYHFTNIRLVEKSQGQVWALKEFDGQIICGHNDGTFLVEGDTFRQISSVTGGWSYTPLGDYIIGGTYTGIVLYQKSFKNKWEFYLKLDNFFEPSRYIEVDYLGYIWASHHQKGVYRIEISEDFKQAVKAEFFPSINDEKLNLKVFKINNRVVFTTSENVYTYDYVRNEITIIEPLSKDVGDYRTANQISHYQKNEYWFIKEDRIALFEIGLDFSAQKLCEVQLKSIKLPQHNVELIGLDESTVLIPTPEGFDTYNLSLKMDEGTGKGLTINKVVFSGRNNQSVTHANPKGDVKTAWNLNSITVHFIAPYSFDHPNKHFAYRIKEFDSPWQNTINCQFTFPGLKYGDYTIEIKDYLGITTQMRVSIAKPWYYSGVAKVGYLLVFMLIAWLLMKYLRYKINREKEISAMEIRQSSLEKELDYKSYELMLTIRYLISKNEILTVLQKEIETIKEHSSKYPVKNLRNMEMVINEGLQSQTEDWKNTINKLKLSQQGFNKNLLEHFPDLTPNDLRLCSYLRMNFSTKEIARLLNISHRAVEISRYRLRKKLNLNHDENLTEYLMSETFSAKKQ